METFGQGVCSVGRPAQSWRPSVKPCAVGRAAQSWRPSVKPCARSGDRHNHAWGSPNYGALFDLRKPCMENGGQMRRLVPQGCFRKGTQAVALRRPTTTKLGIRKLFVKDVYKESVTFRDTNTILNNETLYPMFSCERCELNVF